MKTKDEFYEMVAGKIKGYLPEVFQEARITVDEIYKPGNVRTGITVSLPSESIAPVIYLEDAYQKYMSGQWTENEVLRSVADDIVRLHQQMDRPVEDPMLFKDYEACAAMIQPELLSKSQDPAFLEKYAYTYEQPDCIATYAVQLNDHMKMRITNAILDVWGVSKEALREKAIQNMSDPVFQPLWQVLEEKFGVPKDMTENVGIGLYLLTNQTYINGAAELMRPEVLEMVGESLKGDYFVLPSSVHEVLCLQDDGNMSVEDLRNMVCEINETQVELEERLSDAIGYYNRSNRKLYDVRTEKELKDSLEKSVGKKEQRKKKYR